MTFTNKDIHLVDFSFYLHRSYHVMKNMKVTINGMEKPTGHIKGVLDYIKRIKESNRDAIIFLCLDDLPIHKIQLLESINIIYKDGRAKNEYNIRQDTDLICNLAYFVPNVYTAFCEGEEADDVISTLCHKYKKDNKVFIHSSDKDLVQLLDKQCYIITEWDGATPIKTTLDNYKTSPKYEKAFLNCVPHKLTYFRTIVGDSSDNMKGLYRFPRRLAKMIAENTKSIEDFKEATTKFKRFTSPTQMKYLQAMEESYTKLSIYYEVMKLKNNLDIEIDRTIVSVKKDIEQLKLESYRRYLESLNIKIL